MIENSEPESSAVQGGVIEDVYTLEGRITLHCVWFSSECV